MGVPTSEVGYTSATTGRGEHEVHKGHVVALEKKKLAEEVWTLHERYFTLYVHYLYCLSSLGNWICFRLKFPQRWVLKKLDTWQLLISATLAAGKRRKATRRPKQNRQKSVYAGLHFIWRKQDGDILHGFVQAY
jgi:hypothetical protein